MNQASSTGPNPLDLLQVRDGGRSGPVAVDDAWFMKEAAATGPERPAQQAKPQFVDNHGLEH